MTQIRSFAPSQVIKPGLNCSSRCISFQNLHWLSRKRRRFHCSTSQEVFLWRTPLSSLFEHCTRQNCMPRTDLKASSAHRRKESGKVAKKGRRAACRCFAQCMQKALTPKPASLVKIPPVLFAGKSSLLKILLHIQLIWEGTFLIKVWKKSIFM